MELKDTLKQIREKNGLTKRELCEKTGISERAYLTYEFGEREPKISVIQKLADFYGVTTDYLLGRNSQKSNELTPTQREEIATQKWLQGIDIPILHSHELRHTRATLWINNGANLFAVADVLGHADLKMLRKRYAHSDVESTRELLKIDEADEKLTK